MKAYVYAFYPNLPIRTRCTAYDLGYERNEMYEYMGTLRLIDTPYIAVDGDGKFIEISTCDLTRERMAELLQEAWDNEERANRK